jgi:hypothetical protein
MVTRTKTTSSVELPPTNGHIEVTAPPIPLPRPRGKTSEAPSPMELHPKAIPWVIYSMTACGGLGYLALLGACILGRLDSTPAWTLLGVHTVGVFGLLLRYLGGTMKVTATSAGAG